MKKLNVGVITGSKSDMPIVEKVTAMLSEIGLSYEVLVASAHRTPEKVITFAKSSEKKYDVIIAIAGMAAALPGIVAAHTTIPVIGVPVASKNLQGQDALFSIVQMPPGVPVACVAIDGGKNAAILAAQIIGLSEPKIKQKLKILKKIK
ncbi:5-(carboxyamino)imidazole ribonucleotide mutase [candidate division WOR-1 bacterium RIFOXYD2_FULL_36_8]|uniref:N5-carboxyaminoimidazole ribonucleotide mutase n=1 Tax=candidate division WOR-1 bacterium RIFOXYB2_FULL_36_35 TaxID=1802578 RepID=A0A1F4S5N4_UNCSA|nr:MAG: 5-(carboxyamino)imidazole ribonucleotide mutase [candidate division WOR-1 bacterium RIFOXYA2_FULL_36_21]OGC15748.1 MAG: 5-(carboxyamino)imidazole ribonucleotide mutase [candidate division WOR-1 bacterium RIFOXYB2_FULL_36_35]OGC21103.1 MAG: 5-(carboxyamino)imidazole ribonucleotide mutase [candidate division WOR-1 bacterium RIFOXYA12_FULL_36_13]OGC41474.1 MAG: 5-(carboxyamino)imidazole ribonucleotide mutase [candidate division WOR-1 bacterium RIFOXYD2_FULL_36_8]